MHATTLSPNLFPYEHAGSKAVERAVMAFLTPFIAVFACLDGKLYKAVQAAGDFLRRSALQRILRTASTFVFEHTASTAAAVDFLVTLPKRVWQNLCSRIEPSSTPFLHLLICMMTSTNARNTSESGSHPLEWDKVAEGGPGDGGNNSKQPGALYIIFFIEMWERFGFYTMIALFSLYLKNYFHLSAADASMFYGVFNAGVYFTPLGGGYAADKWLGRNKPIYMGIVLMGLGYFTLGQGAMWHVWLGMGLIVIGNGLFKPNMSNKVGALYLQGDPRRDAGFSIFYMGINVGAFFAPIVADVMQTRYGWTWAFNGAGIGMVFALIIALATRPWLERAASNLTANLVVQKEEESNPALARLKILAICLLAGVIIFFWMAFHQNGNVLAFWADNNTRAYTVPVVAYTVGPFIYNAVNPFFIVTLTGPLNRFYAYLRKRKMEPSTPAKMGIGMVLTGLSYAVMVGASLAGGNTGKVSPLWLIGCYFIITLGELHVSPMGLSTVTKMAPKGREGIMMGVWMFSTCIGNFLCGLLGKLWTKIPNHEFFAILVVTSFLPALVLWASLRFLKSVVPSGNDIKKNSSTNAKASSTEVTPVPAASTPNQPSQWWLDATASTEPTKP